MDAATLSELDGTIEIGDGTTTAALLAAALISEGAAQAVALLGDEEQLFLSAAGLGVDESEMGFGCHAASIAEAGSPC